ncbi:MAG: hypothetical protein KF729_13140 [Sandaracinaceae bacterium]|nr:hypothetical protein [Sandaracinaceae bacterium]
MLDRAPTSPLHVDLRPAFAVALGVLAAGCSLLIQHTTFADPDGGASSDAGTREPDADAAGLDGAAPPDDASSPLDAGCRSDTHSCSGTCVDLQSSMDNCGACDRRCEAQWICRNGECLDPPVAVTAAFDHTCTLRASGRVFCWGRNINGQLGDGTVSPSTVPVEVRELTDAVDVSAAGSDTAGTTCATRRTGQVRCWGANNGAWSGGDRVSPEPINVPPALAVAQSAFFGCALAAATGPHCWDWRTEPMLVVASDRSGSWAQALSAGGGHACAVTFDGRVYCHGENRYGQLGVPRATLASATVFRSVPGLTQVAEVATSADGTCVRRLDGSAACFGVAVSLASGGDALEEHPEPEEVLAVSDVHRIAGAQMGHGTCAIHGPSRNVTCWGSDFARIGREGVVQSGGSPPARLSGIEGATDVAVSAGHVCVVADASVSCLGLGEFGQLGDGRATSSADLVRVSLP